MKNKMTKIGSSQNISKCSVILGKKAKNKWKTHCVPNVQNVWKGRIEEHSYEHEHEHGGRYISLIFVFQVAAAAAAAAVPAKRFSILLRILILTRKSKHNYIKWNCSCALSFLSIYGCMPVWRQQWLRPPPFCTSKSMRNCFPFEVIAKMCTRNEHYQAIATELGKLL